MWDFSKDVVSRIWTIIIVAAKAVVRTAHLLLVVQLLMVVLPYLLLLLLFLLSPPLCPTMKCLRGRGSFGSRIGWWGRTPHRCSMSGAATTTAGRVMRIHGVESDEDGVAMEVTNRIIQKK